MQNSRHHVESQQVAEVNTLLTDGTRLLQPVTLTLLPNLAAQTAERVTITIGQLCDLICDTEANSKAALPLLFGGTLGDVRSRKNSLRHDANVIAVTCLVGDYDREVIAMDDAAERLEIHDIAAVFYKSPRWTAARPRWRVVCPLSAPHLPSSHAALIARLDSALGRILADESFVLSQSFFYGRVVPT
jgi:hypothetical protein